VSGFNGLLPVLLATSSGPDDDRSPAGATTRKIPRLFVSEYFKDFNGAAAYARTYRSRNPAACAAHAARLVADGRVKERLETEPRAHCRADRKNHLG
jgi:hypothetical protein